jgi:hypothetical protein
MSSIVLKVVAGAMFIPQLGCQMSQSANPQNEKNAQSLGTQAKVVSAQPIKLLPTDDASQDPFFAEFRNQLLKAARNHDVNFVISILDPNVKNGSDTERGITQFKNQWQLDQRDSRLWEVLTTILAMGGSFRANDGAREFCAPYVTSKWPAVVSQLPQRADPLDYQVITDNEVAMKSQPNSSATTLAVLSYDVVKVSSASVATTPSSGNSSNWMKITTLAGQDGYVPDKYVRSATDYHACFKKVDAKWFMNELAALE